MPLIDHCYYIFVTFYVVDLIEDSFVSLVDQDALLLGAHSTEQTDKKVDSASINRFCEGLSSSHMEGVDEVFILRGPAAGQRGCFEISVPEKGMGVEIRLNFQGFNSDGIENCSSVYFSDVIFACIFAGKVGLKSWAKEVEIFREL